MRSKASLDKLRTSGSRRHILRILASGSMHVPSSSTDLFKLLPFTGETPPILLRASLYFFRSSAAWHLYLSFSSGVRADHSCPILRAVDPMDSDG